ncbi:acetoacetate--CoA ligase (plasmid) [Aminobacter sp. SR38]|jgi:acetoacetyl-CoA synthetase|uniref:acetoacetate--CoA ligase n=1 Tax=Aminobacter sp. SR38 TaxID=2774562 RepID=UPI00177FED43|nr:acetoacetate--CoA ligase [Aminobacter sp. SR38]QOF75077.1 acetoacetate--CoA ligase [Aminobacter sp. SR38]
MTDILWVPGEAQSKGSLLAAFMETYCPKDSYEDLWQWSVSEREAFWRAVWEFCDVLGDSGGRAFVNAPHPLDAHFFPEARFNYAETMLRAKGAGDGAPALIGYGEDGSVARWSFGRLRATVSRLQQALSAAGVGKGSRVAGVLPNIPETVALMLAVASLGGTWASASPDFGSTALMDRLGQIAPKLVFVIDAYDYNGARFSCSDRIESLRSGLGSEAHVIPVPFVVPPEAEAGRLENFVADHAPSEIAYALTGFRDPLFILFSSGTTGLPKCMVHSAGGALIQHLKEHQLQCDIRPADRLFYYTTCGWMMWNWQASALGSGATLVLFDGSPVYPDVGRLAAICAAEKVTHFGTSAKYLEACDKAGIAPGMTNDLGALRVLLSTGSPLSVDGFSYVYTKWKRDLRLSSIAGGTDILGCFVGGSPINFVIAGECQKRQLGMEVAVVDCDGVEVPPGTAGELVCRGAHPSMPIGFLNDPCGLRYRAAYFERFPGVWHQGDLVTLSVHGGMVFHGRSDSVLNPGGVRIGTAEIYREVNRIEGIRDSVVVGQQVDNDVLVILFVQTEPGVELSETLIAEIKTRLRRNASPRHVPALIHAVLDIPYTKTGKISELAVRDVVNGRSPGNLSALRNPEALDQFRLS